MSLTEGDVSSYLYKAFLVELKGFPAHVDSSSDLLPWSQRGGGRILRPLQVWEITRVHICPWGTECRYILQHCGGPCVGKVHQCSTR